MMPSSDKSEIILYKTDDGAIKIDTVFLDETIWLTQAQMAELFDVKRPAVTKHLKNIFESGELDEQVVSSILEHTTADGAIEGKTQKKQVKYYNLDAIIAVGYRVNSRRATQFRIWATHILNRRTHTSFLSLSDLLQLEMKYVSPEFPNRAHIHVTNRNSRPRRFPAACGLSIH